jgi:tRNA-2-methylthio-N6-dimethylallyladenosine synthase
VREIGFDSSFSFVYSARPGTPAAELPDETPLAEKKARLARLQALLEEQAAAISRSMVGGLQTVLVEGPSKKDPREMSGRTANNRVVNFPGQPRLAGHLVELRITEALAHSLRGEVVAVEGDAGRPVALSA